MITTFNKTITLALVFAILALISESSSAFLKSSTPNSRNHVSSRTGESSSTAVGIFGFLGDAKKNLVKSLAGEYDAEAIQARTNGLIKDNPVLMLSFTTCPFCVKAKGVLDGMGTKYTVVELDADQDGKAIRAELGDLIGRTSVPAIWIGQEFVGGCNDGPMGGVVKLSEEGKLEGMLREVGAI